MLLLVADTTPCMSLQYLTLQTGHAGNNQVDIQKVDRCSCLSLVKSGLKKINLHTQVFFVFTWIHRVCLCFTTVLFLLVAATTYQFLSVILF